MYWLRRNNGDFHKTLQTLDGEKDIFIRSCRIEKSIQNQELFYHVIVRTGTPELNAILQEQIEMQCQSAIFEMFSAKADVIGMQDLLENHGIQPDKEMNLKINLTVTVN